MKFKFVTDKEEERNITEERQPVSKAKYSTVKDTAHKQESKQVDEEQYHPVAKQVCKEVHYVVRYRDMAGQECTHGAMDMVNVFKQLSWEYKVTDDQTSAMTLLYLQEGDRASKKGHTQSTLSMASKHMPINQIKKIEEVTNPTTRAQPSHNDGVKDRRVLLKTTSDCFTSLQSKKLCNIGSVGGIPKSS